MAWNILRAIEFPPDFNPFEFEWELYETVSASTLNIFKKCPLRYRLRKDGAPTIEVDMTYAIFGTNVHAAIAGGYSSLSSDSWTTAAWFRERMENFIYKVESPPRGKNMKKIVDSICRFEEWRRRRYSSESQIPKGIELKFSVPPFHGFIDFAAHDFIIDWKTGRGSVTEDYITQANVYVYSGIGLGFGTKKGFLGFVETGMKPMIPINLEKVLKEAYAFLVLTSDPNFDYPACPSPEACRWCEYTNICEAKRSYAHEFVASILIQKRMSRLMEVGLV